MAAVAPDPQKPTRLRLFVAVSLPDPVKARILEAQGELRAAIGEEAVRWTKPEQFHLTLRFLGSVEAAKVEELKQALLPACRSFPLRLRAASIGFFPGPRSPRVVWVGITEAANALEPLQEAIQAATARFTLEPPEKRFTGHITLGRAKTIRRLDAERLTNAAAPLGSSVFGEWTAPEVHLIRSELNPKGARYTVLEAFPLVST